MDNFHDELKNLINKYSMENGSDTPDFILADYLQDCLIAFDKAVMARRKSQGEPTVNQQETNI